MNKSTSKHTKKITQVCPISDQEYMDVTTPEIVEILIRFDRKVIWINIDGRCMFRACHIKELVLNDESKLL